ncbi:putative late blight resistance protein homolog R1A-3 [Coffea arabica]|uniref:Late blight resistance protein homolog R1A-3 n=1 Tax=Coffea arabica TaxID=13443 RepID=A0A6P6SAK7_COFAR
MASSSIPCIRSAIDDLRFLRNICEVWERHFLHAPIGGLAFLRTFLLCARKCSNHVDANLAALLVRIEDVISRRAQEIHSFRLATLEGDGFPNDVVRTAYHLGKEIRSFNQEINHWYVVFSDCSSGQSTDSLVNKDDLMELMDSLLENLVDFSYWQNASDLEVVEHIGAFRGKLTFLKNFLHFITPHEVEDGQLELLLTHTEAVAVNVARHIFMCGSIQCKEKLMQIKNGDSCKLMQNIVPVETCKALIASNLSSHSHREIDEQMLKDFVDMLLSNLWDILKSGTCLMIHLRDQLQKLYEGLRSLRNILKEKPKKFDEKMRDLTGLVVHDAGLAIFSLSLNARNDELVKEMHLVSSDLLENFKVIQATVAEEFPKRSSFKFPRTNELGFIDFLLKYMMDLTSPEASSVAFVSYPIQTIQEELVFLRSFLQKIVELRNENEELQSLWDRVVQVAYRVEFLIDSLLVGYILDSSSMSFDSVVEEIKIIKAQALNFHSKMLDLKVEGVTKRIDHMPSQGSKPMINDVVVGFKDEATSIINRLTRGSRQVQIVPIVGMPGLGKTTLAKKIYYDASVMHHFHTRAWCTVSQVYHKKNLLLEILTCINSKLSEKFFEMSEEDLAHQVKRRLLRNKYLIVLDDVWDSEVWKGLEASFPDDGNGSRVILTSRLRDIAPQDKLDQEPHSLRQLTHDESWDLLQEKFCPGKDSLPPELCELRTQIVEMCQGLPLTIVILAGILANMEQSGWKEVVQSLSSSNISSTEQCTAALELSYRHLPDNLKPCFLYFGGFPEDHEHTIERLIWLWVAEGFVETTHSKSAEDVANDFMMNLIGRSLVMVSKQRSTGGVRACRIHDLLHELCVKKAKEEKFLQLVRGYDELYAFNVPHHLRRLCINSKPEHFQESRLSIPTVRCLLFFKFGPREPYTWFDLSFIFQVFKLLRVLDLSQINLGATLPREIGSLVQLRYLAVLGNMKSIPSSITNLSNLETLILEIYGWLISLPDTIWNMKRLRHLHLKDESLTGGFDLPMENLDNSSQLCNLDTFSWVSLSSWENMDKILRKIPNIRKLKCRLVVDCDPAKEGSYRILVLDFLGQLESLNLRLRTEIDERYPFEFHFSLTIKKLTLSCFCLPWSDISAIADLPNLQVLKLLEQTFVGEEWNMKEEEFPKLQFLKLASLDIVKWTALECENSFPRLQKLVLENCYNLVEIPSSLGNVSTLDIIELSDCPSCASSVNEIQEEQISMGNTDFKVISSSRDVLSLYISELLSSSDMH